MVEYEDDQGGEVRCPSCGSTEVDEFRMGVNHYRLGRRGVRFERVMPDSEDTVFRRCVDCGHGDNSDAWERLVVQRKRRIC